jgi:hypothetical protein
VLSYFLFDIFFIIIGKISDLVIIGALKNTVWKGNNIVLPFIGVPSRK